MKKKTSIIKILVLFLILSFGVGGISTAAQVQAATPKNGWVKKTYYYKNGKMQKSKWVTIGKYKYYFASNGKVTKGIDVIKGKFYRFTSSGKYDAATTKKLQAAAKYEKNFATLKKLIGKPKKSVYMSGCYGPGKDGILTYSQFKVYTYKYRGKEIFMGAE